jgi:phosphatidylglycerol lysyltransferase
MQSGFKPFLKKYWEVIVGILFIGLAIYFLIRSKAELGKIIHTVTHAKPIYLIIGLLVSGIYIMLQSLMYYFSFRTVQGSVPFIQTTILFLKRFVVGSLLPAGGIATLAFFSSEAINEKTNENKVHIGSLIYGFVGVFSVFLFSLPGLFIMVASRTISHKELIPVIILLGFILLITTGLYSVYKRTWAFKIISKVFPRFKSIQDEFKEENFNKSEFIKIIIASLFLDLTGVVHLYIAMKAISPEGSIEEAFLGHIASATIMIISPFLKGSGAVEASLTYILEQYGFKLHLALSISLLYRLFQFWISVFIGLLLFILKPKSKPIASQ